MTGTGPVSIPASGTVTATVTNTYTPAAPGSLVVQKTISGAAAGSQGQVRISVLCDEMTDTLPDFVIAAGATGAPSKTYTGIPAGANCTISEDANGSSSTVKVHVDGSPQTVTVPAGFAKTAELTDTYTPTPGSLTVQKSITGSAAGQQGKVRIAVNCGQGSPSLDDFVIPAGTKPDTGGTISKTYSGIPAGATCTATETSENGQTSTVAAVVLVGTDHATIPAAGNGTVELSDAYTFVPGELTVTKTVSGLAAGKQGEVTIVPTCDGTKLDPFVIKAAAPAGDTSRTYPAIPANATCTVTETVDGHSTTVGVAVTGSGRQVTIPPARAAKVTIVDNYTDAPGTLIVNKTIAGGAAGEQSAVTIGVTCGGTAQPDFVIPANAAAGSVSKTYTGIAAGSSCTVTETVDGHTTTVSVVQTGSGQQVTVAAGGAATANLSDTYTEVPGTLDRPQDDRGTCRGPRRARS